MIFLFFIKIFTLLSITMLRRYIEQVGNYPILMTGTDRSKRTLFCW